MFATTTPRAQVIELLQRAADTVADTRAGRPVVVLGRDAWPMVPLLKKRGVPTQYFVWSRLQTGDPHTERRWLWETPPGSLVIDTGYAGSIIDRIRELDPTVTGALLSSAVPHKYPSLCAASERGTIVGDIEYCPKLIRRVRRMEERGRLVYSDGYDGSAVSAKDALGFNLTLCLELGVDARWARFTGMTPWARIGCRPKEVADWCAANLLARLDRDLPVEPPAYGAEFGGGGEGGYGWKKTKLVPAKEGSPAQPGAKPAPQVPVGATLVRGIDSGITYALFDHMLMVDWDVDDGTHPNPRKQCLVDTPGEAWLRLHAWCEKNPGHLFRFYLTPGGARAFCVSHFLHPKDGKAQQILKELRCDKLYREMSEKKGVWACRLSPKPGRADDYVARFAGWVGNGAINAHAPLTEWHDEQCAKYGGGVPTDLKTPF